MAHKILSAAGIFCLICAIYPIIVARVFNIGNIVFLTLFLLSVIIPRYWGKIVAVKPLRYCVVIALSAGICYAAAISFLMAKQAYFNAPPDSGKIAVIVLGSRIRDDQPSLMLRRRLDVAHAYLLKNPDSVCVVAGGQGPDEDYPEAVVMKNYLVSLGIADDRVILEDKSTNTRENLKFAAALLPEPEMCTVVVTDAFHQLRAKIFAQAVGLTPYALSSSTPWGLFPAYWVRDLCGVAWAWVTIK